MSHYDYLHQLEDIWLLGVERYREGLRSADEMFSREQLDVLASVGQTSREFFDYAEDFVNDGEPTFADVATVADVRRAYFMEVQHGKRSEKILSPDSLPNFGAELGGIVRLPRVLAKARAKLRGELHPEIMYGCGGDRAFLKLCDIHPAEFLWHVWVYESDEAMMVRWVQSRIGHTQVNGMAH